MGTLADILVVLLQRFGKVALQDFGTFHIRKQSAVFGLHRNSISPPFEIVEFSQDYEKDYDFITLAGHLTVTSAFSYAELRKMLHDFLGHLNSQTESILGGIGTLKKSGDSILFITVDKFNGELFGLEPQSIQPIPLNHPRNQEIVLLQKTDSVPLIYKQKRYENSVSHFLWPLVVLLITIMVIAGRYISCNKIKTVSNPPAKVKVDTIIEQPVSIAEPEVEIIEAEEGNTSENTSETIEEFSGECVIIVGSFTKNSNAQRMLKKVKRAGYTPYFENSDGRVRVGMSFECKEDDLTDSMQSMRKKFARDAWYLKPQVRIE